MNRPVILAATLMLACSLLGCTSTPSTPAATVTTVGTATAATSQNATPNATPSATRTPAATPTATSTPATGSPASPTNLKLTGRIPDLSTPIPPGEGEAGRLTLAWEGGTGATGFRIYLKECDGTVKRALDVPGADHQYGPIHVCRPTGNIGVSAFNTSGESSITWVR